MPLTQVQSGMMDSTAQYYSFKNRIINGAMSFWQRGTSYSGTPSSVAYGSVDRWAFYSTSPIVASRSTDIPTNFQYSLRVQRPASATTTAQIYTLQVIESVNMLDLAGQSVTLSFWAKAGANYSAASSLLTVNLNSGTVADQGSGSGLGGWTGNTTPINVFPTLTTTWTRYSYTATIPANSLEISVAFYYTPSGTAGADDSFYITGVQLEKGSTATSFDVRPYGTELLLCQRYYYRRNYDQSTTDVVGNLSAYNTTSAWGKLFDLPVEMRATPTPSFSGIGNFRPTNTAGSPLAAFTGGSLGQGTTRAQVCTGGWAGSSGLTAGNCVIVLNNTTSAWIDASAEL